MSAPHLCDYTAGACQLPGVHGGVPDPDPATARIEDFRVVVNGYDGETTLSCAHYGCGCWWEQDFGSGSDAIGNSLGALLAAARAHLAESHRRTIEASVVTSVRALPS